MACFLKALEIIDKKCSDIRFVVEKKQNNTFKETRSVTMNIFRKKKFLFKSF